MYPFIQINQLHIYAYINTYITLTDKLNQSRFAKKVEQQNVNGLSMTPNPTGANSHKGWYTPTGYRNWYSITKQCTPNIQSLRLLWCNNPIIYLNLLTFRRYFGENKICFDSARQVSSFSEHKSCCCDSSITNFCVCALSVDVKYKILVESGDTDLSRSTLQKMCYSNVNEDMKSIRNTCIKLKYD